MRWFEDPVFANNVCELVYEKYEHLGKKGKPEFGREWTILAGVVAVFEQQNGEDYKMELTSLSTGSKCLGKNQLSPSGNLVNDSHAEVIARRGFLRYLYHELEMAFSSEESVFKVEDKHGTCSLKDGVSFHLFTSHTPCGDASIFPKGEDDTVLVKKNVERKRKLVSSSSDMPLKFICGESLENKTILTTKNDEKHTKVTVNNAGENRSEGIADSFLAESGGKNEHGISRPRILTGVTIETGSCVTTETGSGVTMQTVVCQPCLCKTRDQVCTCVNDNGRQSFLEKHDIYRTGAKCVPYGVQDLHHDTGTKYHSVGTLRTKPGRGDPTVSMSCSDKLMKWCVLGCQGALVSYFMEKPIYLSSVVTGKCAYSVEAMKRAIITRAHEVKGLPDGYSLNQPKFFQVDFEFKHSKRKIEEASAQQHQMKPDQKLTPSPSAIVFVTNPPFHEISVSGLRQGVTKRNRASQKARVCICKAELFSEFKKIASLVPKNVLSVGSSSDPKTYKQVKNGATKYNKAKEQFYKVFSTWMKKPPDLEMFT